ncbi:MAG: hypothetical protein ACYS6K_26670 [Planctomycetota bacterium]|jgi:hypothetical protein
MKSAKKLTVESGDQIHDRILDRLLRKLDQSERQAAVKWMNIREMIVKSKVSKIAAALLVISSLAACFVLSRRVTDLKNQLEQAQAKAQQDVAVPEPDNSATINLYLREHQDVIARHVSLPTTPQPAQMRVSQDDILYFEFFDDGPEYMHPGIIVRGPLSQREIGSPEAPVISNGHTLTLLEARKNAGFELQAPPRLHPGYSLDQIRRIEGRDTLQLLYTDGINSVSLFEQPLDGQRGLSRQDFREYAVYRDTEKAAGTILAWRDDVRSYVLIGNTEMSQLMNMAQSISAGK